MNKPIVYACLTLAWITVSVSPMAARESTDVVIMKNGDKITGEIKGLHDGSLAISLDYVDGTVSLQWSKVARLESTQPFIVETQAGPVYSGVLSTAESDPSHPIELQITETVQKPVVIEALQIVRIEQSSPKFWKRLNGAITFGINYSKGNQATQYSFGTEADYVRERWALQGSFNSNLSSNSGADTSTRNQLNASGYHLLRWDNYFTRVLDRSFRVQHRASTRRQLWAVASDDLLRNLTVLTSPSSVAWRGKTLSINNPQFPRVRRTQLPR
jgi:hypothetical protein